MNIEEDIKISLEERFKEALIKGKQVREYVKERNDGCEPSIAECLAYDMNYVEMYVENLISRNKELEEIEKAHQEENGELRERVKELEEDLHELYISNEHKKQNWVNKAVLNSYIPKSVIKEKIEELEQAYEDSKDEYGESPYFYPDYTINILQELLEKEK